MLNPYRSLDSRHEWECRACGSISPNGEECWYCREQDAAVQQFSQEAAARQEAGRKIVTSCICPPIPDRRFDWCAYYADTDGAPCGYGRTEAEAMADLELNTYGDRDAY